MSDDGRGWDARDPAAPEGVFDPPLRPPPAPGTSPTPPAHGGPQWHGGSVPAVPAAPVPRSSPAPSPVPATPGDADEQAAELARIWRESRVEAPEHRRFRSRGPRVSGRGVLGVFGLLGLLLTIAILGLLVSRMLSSL